MLRPEPTSPVSMLVFGLRQAASMMKNFPARAAERRLAGRCLLSPGPVPVLNYGSLVPPKPGRLPIGGQIKLIPLQRQFPERLDAFNLIYLVSSALPPEAEQVVASAKSMGAKLVWNQNGIAYPGCYGDFYPWFNRRMAALRAQADYIFNQSEFSRTSAERYLGPSAASSEICLNPVDIEMFSPAADPLPQVSWQILAAGTSHALYRTKSALDTLRALLSRGRPAHLTIAGEFRWKGAEAEVRKEMEGIRDRVTILPPFQQCEAPAIYQRAHVLLHTKFNDPCPTVPIEAMACGVPVVGTHSGGMPELVPGETGVLAPVSRSWTRDLAGAPNNLADAVERVMDRHADMSRAAREHAVRTFDVAHWLARHDAVFHELLDS